MCTVQGAVSTVLLGLVLVGGTAGCTAATTSPGAGGGTATHRAASTTSATRLDRALGSCGLSTAQAGVTRIGTSVRLVTPLNGHPTGVDRADVACTLAALELPRSERQLFWSSSISGGYQSVQWSGYAASWTFRDTLTFEVDLYPGP